MQYGRTKTSLSNPRQRLLKLMQTINFGRIEGLSLVDGEPILEPTPRVIAEIKFGGENGPRPERDAPDFVLKTQVVELFHQFDAIRNGTIEVLEIKHGLPFRMLVPHHA